MLNKTQNSKLKTQNLFDKGLTLIEVLVAVAVFAIGILAILGMFSLEGKIAQTSQSQTIASNLAQEKMEEIFPKKYEEVVSESKETLSDPYSSYERKVEVKYVDKNLQETQEDLGLKKIEVTVFWKNIETKLDTLISKY